MKMLKLILIIATVMLSLPASAQTTEIGGVKLQNSLERAGSSLVLNGGGIREKLWFDLYVGGLYLPSKSSDAAELIKADQATMMQLTIISKLVSSENMSEAIIEGFEKSTGGNTAPLQDKIDQFISFFNQEPIVKGNVFELIYAPGSGLKVLKDGKKIGNIAGLDFKQALWGIWLGEEPADNGLKAGMLGG
jgi:hypothetical protein